jgi:FkbM family methyltransferase
MTVDPLIAELELELAVMRRELERARVELDVERHGRHREHEARTAMQVRIDALGFEVRRVSGKLAELQNELDSTYGSASWRVTALLRRLRWSGRPSRNAEDETDSVLQPAVAGAFVRIGTSDLDVFRQVFDRLEYAVVPADLHPGLIVDCGANVGYASMYLLERFPEAQVIAIEPDPDNAAAARLNLSRYGARATVMEAAVWPRAEALSLRRGAFRDGREWATQVVAVADGQRANVRGIDLGQLIGARTVDLLKIDIERAELELFSAPCPWLDSVRNIVIELHDADCAAAFHNALASFDYSEQTLGELTVCTGIRRRG